LFPDGVVTSLRSNQDIEVVGQVEDAAGPLRVVREPLPDLVLFDVTTPGGGVSDGNPLLTLIGRTRRRTRRSCS